MLDLVLLPQAVSEILVTRLDALGDIVLGTMLLSGLHARWPSATIRLIVRPQLAGVSAVLPDWAQVVPMPFDPRQDFEEHENEIVEHLREFASRCRADLAIVAEYNRTWAGEILVGLCGASHVIAFDGPTGLNFRHHAILSALKIDSQEKWNTVAVKAEERESTKYAKLLTALGTDGNAFQPNLLIREEDRHEAHALWAKTGEAPEKSIVCFPSSGEGLIRSLDAPAWGRWIARLRLTRPVMLLGTEADVPVLEAIESCGTSHETSRIIMPVEKVGVTAAFIECGAAYVGMDTGPTHLAAVLNRPTLAVFGGGHRAERFLPVGQRAAAVYMPIDCYGCDWLCPFDSRLCIKEIPEWPLSEIGDAFLNDFPQNADPFSPKIYKITAPSGLPTVLLGPIMRQHRRFLQHNHEQIEHHHYLAQVIHRQNKTINDLSETVTALAEQNHQKGRGLAHLATAFAEMTRQNQARDHAIEHVNKTLADMTKTNESRDEALHHLDSIIARMTQGNQSSDSTIGHLNDAVAKMTNDKEPQDPEIGHATQTLTPDEH